jgi:geranylgeranyl diphosphate synthase type II
MPEIKANTDRNGVSPALSADEGLPAEFRVYVSLLEEALEKMLPGQDIFSGPVVEAMRYSLMAPGKRIRPVLTMLSAEIAGGKWPAVLEAACAIEMIHTASLILDDLPCMDDSNFRRGRKTLHRHTDEATAVLAADALLMQAFRLIGLAVVKNRLPAAEAGKIIEDAADCIGVPGMIGGQWKDLHLREKKLEELEYVHSHKTGSLFILSTTIGARLSRAEKKIVECLANYAKNLGLAFQIKDDILNFQSSYAELGKDVLTDAKKITFVTVFGLESSTALAADLIKTAKASLLPLGPQSSPFEKLADYIYLRKK